MLQFTEDEATTLPQWTGGDGYTMHLSIAHPLAFAALGLHQSVQISGDTYTGWPKKVSHYRESSLNRIKNRQLDQIFHQF